MQPKFIAVMGPSGVGKSTLMHELRTMDSRFVLIQTHVTRMLRPGETDRVSLPYRDLLEMRKKGEVLQLNDVYGNYYAALPVGQIRDAFLNGQFPMCDYKIPFVADLKTEIGSVFCVYVLPPNFAALAERLKSAGRNVDESRSAEDALEIRNLDTKYAGLIDLKIVNEDGRQREVAEAIRSAYLKSIES